MALDDERLQILGMIESGKISSAEGIQLLQSLAEADESGQATDPGLPEQTPVELPPDAVKWRSWWVFPLWAGIGLIAIGGSLMYAALQSSGLGFWLVCASAPFTLGLILIVLAWRSRTARWMHLRIRQRPGHTPGRIALSFPLPIRLTAWFFRTFQDRIPGLKNTSVDEIILALDHSATPENPLFISVNDEEDGENVQIFIG